MTTLKEIRKDAIEIGYIDQSIIDRLQEEIQSDQQISLEEANFLFTIKKQFANKERIPRIGVSSSLIPSLVSYLKTKIHPVWSMSKKHNGCARIFRAKAA